LKTTNQKKSKKNVKPPILLTCRALFW